MHPDAHELSNAPFGLLGRKLGHSWSPRIHATLGSSPYSLFEREPDEVEQFVRNGCWKGINVTIPYKHEAALLADMRSPRVDRLGVANTLVRTDDGRIWADNTDVLGFSWMLERFLRTSFDQTPIEALEDKKVLVLGSGGASQAVRAALEDAHARTVVVSRYGQETYATLEERHSDAVLVVNTTPVGMYPNCPDSPVSQQKLEALGALRGVLDVVYNPERTGICLAAERLGLPYESGLAMLVSQAFFSSQSFLEHDLDESLVAKIEEGLRKQTRNVVLIGMPGCGKTSAGRKLARMAGRPFVDLDDTFVIDHKITPAECIRTRGEDEFRRLETKTAAAYGSGSGLVIACGGGIVTREHNYDLLHQNGTIVFLDRPIEELSSEDRPLSQTKGVQRLAAERMGSYNAWADLRIKCTGSSEGDAVLIRSLLGL